MACQAESAHTVFPCNDRPSGKADFTLRLTVPTGLRGMASGPLVCTERLSGGRTAYTYRSRELMVTEPVQITVGDYAVKERQGPHGAAAAGRRPGRPRAGAGAGARAHAEAGGVGRGATRGVPLRDVRTAALQLRRRGALRLATSSGRRPSAPSSAPSSPGTATPPRRRRTTSPSPRTSPARICPGSFGTGCTARRRRGCRGTRTGRSPR
ncbi:hypothetical protein ACIBAG_02370 [Streptomyces sp. NPDC051243]|uniref:hypothetical protein n=1 Tax=Streptomyces sp. NPDC051243 TaxID=3365646 RepID=UPI0037A08260